MEKKEKPDWITDRQWKAVPSEGHWLSQKRGAEYIAQSKPATPEEAIAQMKRLRNEKNWDEGK
jgi:hypothetical protein